uniref:Uncharacterized protein n=1 Tax=Hucho hucho TaxID=62062 RepID=A0A4W5LK24_9TELE
MGGFPMEGHHQPQGQQGHDPSRTQQFPPGAPQEPSVQLLQALHAERVEQREIPAEHMVLKQTFDSLVQRCQLAAQDPQTKRKLDDASKRLGYLYDKLREQTVRICSKYSTTGPSLRVQKSAFSKCVFKPFHLR